MSIRSIRNIILMGLGVLVVSQAAAVDMPRGIDPTEVNSRADLAVRYARDDVKYFGAIFGGECAIADVVAIGASVPLLNVDDPGKTDDTGFGDVSMVVGWRAAETEDIAMRLNLRVLFDTSDDNILGAGNDLLTPEVVGSYMIHEHDAVLGAVLAHSFDVGSSEEKVSETELRPYYLQHLGWGSWYEVVSHLYLDWENDSEFGWFQEARAGQMITDQIGVTADLGFRLAGENRKVPDWSLGMSARYLF